MLAGLIEVAVEARSEDDLARMRDALAELEAADPDLEVTVDRESGQTVLRGVSETHLDRVVGALLTTHGVQANVGAPQVAYRETISQVADIDHTYSALDGNGGGRFARVKIKFEPGEPGSDFIFESVIVRDEAPEDYIPGVEKGLTSAKENGLLAGFPVIDFKATLYAVGFHDVDSSVLAFEIAARRAFKELREKGAPKLLEPVMKVEVVTPDEYMGDVIGDLNSRRGQIQGTESCGAAQVVSAFVPLSLMFGYGNTLRSFSEDRATWSMTFERYEEVPQWRDPDPTFPPAMGMRVA